MAPQRPPLAPELADDVVEEILLRLPPHEPGSLVRASAVSKPWLELFSDPAFRRRYRDFHRTPPLLGFFTDVIDQAQFVPTKDSWLRNTDIRDFEFCDCRHGRVLLYDDAAAGFSVWDPMTGTREILPQRDFDMPDFFGLAVLCAVDGCDHRACHEGPFVVVVLEGDSRDVMAAHVYTSATGEWSAPAPDLQLDAYWEDMGRQASSVLVGDALCFLYNVYITVEPHRTIILKYDLGRNCMSVIHAPVVETPNDTALVAGENDMLQLLHLRGHTLYKWSMDVDPAGVVAWTERSVFNLNFGRDLIANPCFNGSLEGTNVC